MYIWDHKLYYYYFCCCTFNAAIKVNIAICPIRMGKKNLSESALHSIHYNEQMKENLGPLGRLFYQASAPLRKAKTKSVLFFRCGDHVQELRRPIIRHLITAFHWLNSYSSGQGTRRPRISCGWEVRNHVHHAHQRCIMQRNYFLAVHGSSRAHLMGE